MANTLLGIWRDQPTFIEAKSFRQIIQLAGDGRLRDGNVTSQELRDWLAAIALERLRACVEECLSDSFEDGPLALQDAANEIGVRLGFEVDRGRYRGVKGVVGNDGIWRANDGFSLLVEVKTTDAYRINLNTLAGYRESLIKTGKLEVQRSSILIAVGRQETGDLEAQIRGSRHAWDIRLISLEALLRLAEVKEELSDWDTSNKINQLLRPVEYTRLDAIVELLFAAKKDLETPEAFSPPPEVKQAGLSGKDDRSNLETARETAVATIGKKLNCNFVRRGRALRVSSDGEKRLVCIASQRYEGPGRSGNYWFGFTPAQHKFLSEGNNGWVALVCADSGHFYLVNWKLFSQWIPDLLVTNSPTEEGEVRHWHVYFNDYGTRVELFKSGGGILVELSPYLVSLNDNSV
jgi:hypothetical protein